MNPGTVLAKDAIESIFTGLGALVVQAFLGYGGVITWALPVGMAVIFFFAQSWRHRAVYREPADKIDA